MVEISLSGSGEGPGWQRPGLLYSQPGIRAVSCVPQQLHQVNRRSQASERSPLLRDVMSYPRATLPTRALPL
jgi:hypothetical protein